MDKVNIIIPIYKAKLSDYELIALNQACNILGNYPIVVIKPDSLNLSVLLKSFPKFSVLSFDDSYFTSIHGYNKLMLSSGFYKKFLHIKYILIYQLDAYVFKDDLSTWCNKNYDYIGAPWLERTIYKYPVIRQWMYLNKWYHQKRGKLTKQSLYNKIGNGGFSLRKVKSHYEATYKYKEKIDYYLSQAHTHFFNEDVFWSTEIEEFTYPLSAEALKFSFDKYPSYCYKLNNYTLPFGCHGWYKRKMRGFWKHYINFNNQNI